MSDLTNRHEDTLYERVTQIIEVAQGHVSRTVNTAMVHAYWLIGREIIEVEQAGKERAEYGDEVVKRLAARLSQRFGRGFSYPSVKRMKQFYLTLPDGSAIPEEVGAYQKGSALLSLSPKAPGPRKGSSTLSQLLEAAPVLFPPLLSWTHYLILMRIVNPKARAFYEIEAARENWSTRELERQVESLLFERLAKSRNKAQVLALAKEGQDVVRPRDVMKDPMVLEFLELEERAHWFESDLEQAIIDRLESFLLELGKGFCFVARQKRITIDGDHYYVDLVFYNRLLRCFVLVDLKLGKLTHQDLGQIQMYVNFFDRHQRVDGEAPTVGIVLCSEKNEAMVRISLPKDNEQIHAGRYLLYLPTEEQLRERLIVERDRFEQAPRLPKGEKDKVRASTRPVVEPFRFARFSLSSKVLPLVEDTVPFAARVRSHLMGIHKRIQGGDPEQVSALFSGKDGKDGPARGHRHAFIIPRDEDGDGRLDHLEIWSSQPLKESELHTLGSLNSVWQPNRRPDVEFLLTTLLPERPQMRSKTWVSATPFVTARHYRKGRGEFLDWLASDLARELEIHGLPSPSEVHWIPATPGVASPIRWSAFVRSRKGARPASGYGARILFQEDVEGPFAVGSLCHYGLGVFVPADGAR